MNLGLGIGLGFGGAPKAFSPSDIAGLALDLNAELGVTGSPITAWANQAGAGSFTAAGSARPTLNATGINGKKAVSFDGVANVLTSTLEIGDVLGAGSYTLMALLEHVAGGVDGSISNKPSALCDNGTYWNGPTLDAQTPSMVSGQFNAGEHSTPPAGLTLSTPQVHLVVYDGATLTAQVDTGTAETVSSTAIGSMTPTLVMGANWNSSVFGQMLIRRLLVWTGVALDAGQIAKVRAYLGSF